MNYPVISILVRLPDRKLCTSSSVISAAKQLQIFGHLEEEEEEEEPH